MMSRVKRNFLFGLLAFFGLIALVSIVVTLSTRDGKNRLISEPKSPEVARALIDKALARGIAGDNAGVYDLFVPNDKKIIPRADYIEYQETCNDAADGLPYEIVDFRMENQDTATAIVRIVGFNFPVHAYYVDGHWLTSMNDENKKGAEYWATHKSCMPDAA